MPSKNLKVRREGQVAHLVIDNPPANVWTAELLEDFREQVKALDADKQIVALTLTGAGDRFFSAGADLKMFADADREEASRLVGLFGQAFETLSQFHGVTIAAINGMALGGGLEAALACDIRLCQPKAQMGLPEAKVGLLPGGGGTQNLPAIVGEGWAKRIILCGETVTAETALRIGLVEEIVDADKLTEAAIQLANAVANQSPTSLRHCKTLIQIGRHRPRWQALAEERQHFLDLWDDDNHREGCLAFLEKRRPNWR